MSYKALFALAAAQHFNIKQMDDKAAFLYGIVKEEIYVENLLLIRQISLTLRSSTLNSADVLA